MIKCNFAISAFLFTTTIAFGQIRFLPMEHYYKDRTFVDNSATATTSDLKKASSSPTFFPVLEADSYSLEALTNAKASRKWVGRKLFDQHFFEYNDGAFSIAFDPIIDVSLGRDQRDIDNKRYFRNTRGVSVSGTVGDYFGFYSTLRENQQRFVDYQRSYILLRGEYYPNNSGDYVRTNGFVPGAARTKEFDTDAFDFAYVTGGVVVRLSKEFTISLGNSPMFIGAGHRSLFLSDHSNMAPHFRFSMKLNEKWHTEVVYAQHLNLVRTQMFNTGTERFYEKKGFTLSYLTYTPISSLKISFFEGTSWQRWTSSEIKRVHPLFYNPIPLVNPLFQGLRHERSNTVLGLNTIWTASPWLFLYGQIAVDDFERFKPAFQGGARFANAFRVKNLHALLEVNAVPETFYQHENPRLNYIHNNMPLAHPMGAGFFEVLGRLNYEWKRIGFSASANLYKTNYSVDANNFFAVPLLPVNNLSGNNSFQSYIGIGQMDVFYRFNRKNNLQLFASVLYRQARTTGIKNETFFLNIGLRTLLSNQYFDF